MDMWCIDDRHTNSELISHPIKANRQSGTVLIFQDYLWPGKQTKQTGDETGALDRVQTGGRPSPA